VTSRTGELGAELGGAEAGSFAIDDVLAELTVASEHLASLAAAAQHTLLYDFGLNALSWLQEPRVTSRTGELGAELGGAEAGSFAIDDVLAELGETRLPRRTAATRGSPSTTRRFAA
jgi:hypothetical protein